MKLKLALTALFVACTVSVAAADTRESGIEEDFLSLFDGESKSRYECHCECNSSSSSAPIELPGECGPNVDGMRCYFYEEINGVEWKHQGHAALCQTVIVTN